MKLKEWLDLPKTKAVLVALNVEGNKRLNAVLGASDRDKQADVTIGFLEAIRYIENLEEVDVDE